jgi:Fanconi-associated nuclease 1
MTAAEPNCKHLDNDVFTPTASAGIPYYVSSFLKILETVQSISPNLLTDSELQLARTIGTLSLPAKALLVRLVLRTDSRSHSHRLSTVALPPDCCPLSAALELADARLAILRDPDSPEEALHFLSKGELCQLLPGTPSASSSTKKNSNLTKQQLVEAILRQPTQSTLAIGPSNLTCRTAILLPQRLEKIRDSAGFLVSLRSSLTDFCSVLKFLYFLDFDTDFSTAILVDLKKLKFPAYSISRNLQLLIPSRPELNSLLFARQLQISIQQSMDLSLLNTAKSYFIDSIPAVKLSSPLLSRRFTPAYCYFCTLRCMCEALESQRLYSDAIRVLELLLGQDAVGTGHFGSLYVRLSINYKKAVRSSPADAIAACKRGLADRRVKAGSRLDLQVRLERLCGRPLLFKFKEIEITAARISAGVSGKKCRYEGSDGSCSVEQVALLHYMRQHGWRGFHCEGAIFSKLFGLLFYDILFDASVPGVFVTECQTHPLDLMTESFFESRCSSISKRLEELESAELVQSLLSENYGSHFGEFIAGVSWEEYPLEALLQIARCIPSHLLCFVCRILAEDFKHCRSGLPDLLLYREEAKEKGSFNAESRQSDPAENYLLVEVKGQGDRLSSSQKFWHMALSSVAANVEICHVRPTTD